MKQILIILLLIAGICLAGNFSDDPQQNNTVLTKY